jgi:hypothetical protein
VSKKGSQKSGESRQSADAGSADKASELKTKASVKPADKLKFEYLGQLPTGYGEMFLIARDPHWLFTYWDFDYSKFPATRKLLLEVYRENELESTIDINEIARNWYIPVKAAASEYRVVFGYRDENDAWTVVGKSSPALTPPESISANWETEFATVPFHLTFNFLLDVISSAQAEGVPLAETLARLQQAAIDGSEGFSNWGPERVKVLETLLGKGFLDRLFSMSSQEVLEFLHAEAGGRMDSETASELLAKGRLAAALAPGESSLFSGAIGEFIRQELASGGVTSLARAELGGVSSGLAALSSEVLAGASETLASWQAGVSAILAKWERALSSLGLGSEVLASWRAGLSEIAGSFSSAISSYGLSSETLGSWQVGVSEIFAKWESALSSYGVSSQLLSSWQAGISEITSSWSSLVSSYGLSSQVLSSWETAFGVYGVSSFGVSSYWQVGVSSILGKWERALVSLGLGSEVLASWRAGLSEIASSFSSAISSYGLSSETLGSWQVGVSEIFAKWESALSSYGVSSQLLASWGVGISEITSSWSSLVSSYGLSSQVLSSWETAFGAYGVSSYGVSSYGLSSYALSSETFGSWETALGSYSVSSYSLGLEQFVSSWGLSSWNVSSWSGLEFGPSSWSQLVSETSLFSGIGASWSGQPFGQYPREFFMHVNAEVIFYGGTDPQAKVTIAGRPVQLQPDGTFRYHFVFPDNEFEIPVVAVSPDGVETRSAVLFLKRDTSRYGHVGATAQPEHLGIPMGLKN